MGIAKSIPTSSAEVPIPLSLAGRAVAADLILPTDSGGSVCHRVIGVYAPSSNHDEETTSAFWRGIIDLCLASPSSWKVIGDANTLMSGQEHSSGRTAERTEFAMFLHESRGRDVWRDYPNKSWVNDWTLGKGDGHAIIDRMITSSTGIIATHLETIKDEFVPGTDHRPIWGSVTINPMHGTLSESSQIRIPSRSAMPQSLRVKYPTKNEKDKLVQFERRVDAAVVQNSVLTRPIMSDAEFDLTYDKLTRILVTEARLMFGLNAALAVIY
jgi:hypothetical protein